MELTSNYSITRLFIEKKIKIIIDKKQSFAINVKTLRDMYTNEEWNSIYHLWGLNVAEWKELFPQQNFNTSFDYICFMIFEMGRYKQYNDVAVSMRRNMEELFVDKVFFNFQTREIELKRSKYGEEKTFLTITFEIWDYVIYLLKLLCGEKVSQPRTYSSPEEMAFYLKQQELEAKIKRVREKDTNKHQDNLIKSIISITYSFPSLTFEYLFDQTLAQIHYLQKLAAGEVSYKINAQAFAAGNMKKNKKLDFFIK